MALPAGIVAAIEAGETLVAPSPQRAAALREAWARRQLAAGRRVWTTPDILSFAAFAERCLLEQAGPGLPRRRPLSRVEQQLLWRQVAASLPPGSDLLSGPGRLAQALRRADGLLRSYAIPATSLSGYPSPEARCLHGARTQIDGRLERLRARLDWTDETVVQGPRSQAVRLAGFSEFTPAQRRFLDRHGVARSARCIAAVEAQTATPQLYAAQQPAEELQQIARWCRERLEAAADARLLVIVPDLDARRTLLQRALLAELDPRALAAGSSSSATFAFEGGAPLLSEPCIATDIGRLEALVMRRERERWLAWLRSAELGVVRGAWHRELERRLLAWQGEPLDFASLLAMARLDPGALPEPLARMRRAAELLDARSAAPAYWARAFDSALAILQGTPLPLDSVGWQIRERWCRMLEEYAAASSLVGAVSARDALAQLRTLAQQTRFAPASPDVPVLVTAATGDPIVEYDGIWVAGLHEAAFPYPARLDGFVPAALQRAYGVAEADPRALLARAEREFAAWRGRTRELVLSWASEHDGAPQSPSPLLRPWLGELQRFPVRAARAAADWLRRQAPAPAVETWSDPLGLPVPAGALLAGGSALLDSANRCAFRGYAQWRLDARGAEEPETGIAAWLRGRLLHDALELLWQQWRDQATLRSVDPQQRRAAVAAALARAARRHAQARQTPLVRRALERELARAEALILEVIDRELERAPFAILALEQAVLLPLDGFSLQCRIDRIDRLVDGSLAIIDYKTGRGAVPTDWHGARPDTVQMMAYRAALEHAAARAPSGEAPAQVAALGYLQLSEGSVRYLGVARDPRTFGPSPQRRPRHDPGWEQRGAEWNAHLRWLAGRVRRAEATVEPRPAICRDCDLSLLCRRAELEPALDLDDEQPPTAVADADEPAGDEA